MEMLNEIDKDAQFSHRVMFSDEATFRVSGHVHRHNVRIRANERPQDSVEHERDSPKTNVWLLLPKIAYWPVFLCGTQCDITQLPRQVGTVCSTPNL
jgi:hypothetical protein